MLGHCPLVICDWSLMTDDWFPVCGRLDTNMVELTRFSKWPSTGTGVLEGEGKWEAGKRRFSFFCFPPLFCLMFCLPMSSQGSGAAGPPGAEGPGLTLHLPDPPHPQHHPSPLLLREPPLQTPEPLPSRCNNPWAACGGGLRVVSWGACSGACFSGASDSEVI